MTHPTPAVAAVPGAAGAARASASAHSVSRAAALPRERLWTAVVLLGVVVLTFYRLGAGSLWDQDETKYAQVAREILRTGDPITMHINGAPWYVHPPFYMWLTAATGRVAGFSEFTVRFWSAAFSLLAVYATVLIGRELFGPRAGILAGVILAVTFQFLVQSRLAVFDTVLMAWMLLGVYAFLRGYRSRRAADYLRFFLFCGLATLTKGPIGLLLPALTVVPFVSLRGAWRRWREVPWAAGIALYVIVGLSWYVAEVWLHGRPFAAAVFGYYGIGRFFGVVENQAGPWYYYVPVLLVGAFPWTAFWPAAAAWHARRLRDDGSLFVGLWCAVTFVFYSLAGTKLPNYVLPIYPFAAIGVAAFWDAALGRRADRNGGTIEGVPAGAALGPGSANAGGGGVAGVPFATGLPQTRAGGAQEGSVGSGGGLEDAALGGPGVSPNAGGHGRRRDEAGDEQAPARGIGWSLVLLAALVAIVYAGVGGYLARLYPARFHALGHVLVIPAVALAAGVVITAGLALRRARFAALVALCAAMAVTWLGIITWVVPVVEAQKPWKPLALAIHRVLRPGDRIVGYRLDLYSSLIYYTNHKVDWVSNPSDLRRAACAPGRAYLVIAQDDLDAVRGVLPAGLTPFAARDGVDVLRKPASIRCGR